MLHALLLLALAAPSLADVYMQNPKGSNNRLNEQNDNTNNGDRLFDSQSNNNGGYQAGPSLYYYEGSWLTVEWTNQHACNSPKTQCELILQYRCTSNSGKEELRMRDGTTTTTIPTDPAEAMKKNDAGDYTYGMHEPLDWWTMCATRQRNAGLFTADQTLNGNTAQFTRQSNNGERHGFECTEERDYYPYWHPSPWKDIAVFTDDKSRCAYFQRESQNVKDKGHCESTKDMSKKAQAWAYNNQTGCEQNMFTWVTDGSWGMAAPECLVAPWSRDNHLGSAITDTLAGYMAHYNMSIPTSAQEPCVKDDTCSCVLRLRYNVTTADYQGREDGVNMIDAQKNSKAKDAVILTDPYVTVGGKQLALALNTDQYGRTFQDRSHIWRIKPRPEGLSLGQRIFNVNVRGKRGNIVQTYPALEYDFVPNVMTVRHLDYIHFQWNGFNGHTQNNGNNNGEGKDNTDCSNVVQVENLSTNKPIDDTSANLESKGITAMITSAASRLHLATLSMTDCASYDDLVAAHGKDNTNAIEQDARNCMKLNTCPLYFDGGVYRMNNTGSFHYMSTRNNNFSNRSQKGSIIVMPILGTWAIVITVVGALLCLGSIGVGAAMIHAKKNPMSRFAAMAERI